MLKAIRERLMRMKLPLPFGLFEHVPDDPFYQPRRPLWLPREMAIPPLLDESFPKAIESDGDRYASPPMTTSGGKATAP